MFGYFRFNQKGASWDMKILYKNYYCGTCFGLEKHYGEMSRFLLSYDVVLLAIIAKIYDVPNDKQLPCFGKGTEKGQFDNIEWKKIAAINVLLFNAEIDDDLNDDNSFKAKVAYIVFRKIIKKAKRDFPILAKIIDEGYQDMLRLEHAQSNVIEICKSFSCLISRLLHESFNVDETMISYSQAIAGWLYFIDQLDDYDSDISEGKFNPLVINGITKLEYINSKQEILSKYIETLLRDFDAIKSKLNRDRTEDKILFSILNETIPSMTFRVMTNQRLPKLHHTDKNNLKWSDS